jgi:multidrug efflux pump subunit AcrA (membrane-fusion protein)
MGAGHEAGVKKGFFMTEKQTEISKQDLMDLDRFSDKQSQASSFDEQLKLPIPNVSRVGSYFMALIMVVTIGLLYFGKVNVVAQAVGFIRTVEKTFQVEAQENGVVTRILARPGDRLKAGADILQLDSAEKGLNVDQLRSELEILEGQLDKYSRSLKTAGQILADPKGYLQTNERADLSGNLLSSFLKLRATWLELKNVRDVQQNVSRERQLQIKKEIQLAEVKITTLEHNRTMGFEEIQRNRRCSTIFESSPRRVTTPPWI